MFDVLKNHVEPLLSDGYCIQGAELKRVKFKPARKLSAYYDLRLSGPGDRAVPIRPIAIAWNANGTAPANGSSSDSTKAAYIAASRGLAAPFSRLEALRPHVRVLISPLDERFPELAQWSDPAFVAQSLREPDLIRHTVSVVRYRPGQRHVLAYRSNTEGDTKLPTFFIKLSGANEGGRPLRTSEALRRWLGAQKGDLSAASPLGQFGNAVLFRRVPGVALSHCIRHDSPEVPLGLAKAGEMLRLIHEAPIAAARNLGLQRHDFAAEVAATSRAGEHVSVMSRPLSSRISQLLDTAQALYDDIPQEDFRFVHGDYKADHLWMSPHGVTLIDFDSARLSDPSLDVGKMLADLWWCYEDRPWAVARAQGRFLETYSAGMPPERVARARLHEAVFLAKVGLRRVPVFDLNWDRRIEGFVRRAELLVRDIGKGSVRRVDRRPLRKVFAPEGSDRQ